MSATECDFCRDLAETEVAIEEESKYACEDHVERAYHDLSNKVEEKEEEVIRKFPVRQLPTIHKLRNMLWPNGRKVASK